MNSIRLQNKMGRISLIGQIVKLAPNSTKAYVLADTPDPDAIGTVAESVPNNYWGLVNLLNSISWSDISDAPLISFSTGSTDDKLDEILDTIKEIEELGQSESELSVDQLLIENMEKVNNMPFQVQLPKDLKQEADGGLLLADMKPFFWTSKTADSPFVIDCSGYQSVLIHKITAGIITPTISNDNVNFYATTIQNTNATLPPAATMPAATGVYVTPVLSRYLKLTGPASIVTCIIYLSQAPYSLTAPLNIAGTNAINANVAGTLAIGGNVATGAAPTTYPVQVAGVDSLPTPLTRRLLTDKLGRVQVGNTPSERTIGINMLGYDPQQRNILEVQETGRNGEGMSEIDLLESILIELRIMNNYLYELPGQIDRGEDNIDDPNVFRNEKSLL